MGLQRDSFSGSERKVCTPGTSGFLRMDAVRSGLRADEREEWPLADECEERVPAEDRDERVLLLEDRLEALEDWEDIVKVI